MQKINFQDLPNTTSPVNATNLNAIQTNVENVFNGTESMGNINVAGITSTTGVDKYSTNEIRVGTWIDGKPLYRRVVLGTLVDGDLAVNLTSSNIYEVIKVDGFCGNQRPLNFYFSGYSVSTRFSDGYMYIFASTPYANENFKMIIEYTKTTD